MKKPWDNPIENLEDTSKIPTDSKRMFYFKAFISTGLSAILKSLHRFHGKDSETYRTLKLYENKIWLATKNLPIENKEVFLLWKSIISEPNFEKALIEYACGKDGIIEERDAISACFLWITPILLRELNRMRVSYLIDNWIPVITWDFNEQQKIFLETKWVHVWEGIIERWPYGAIVIIDGKRYLRCKIQGEIQDIECSTKTMITDGIVFLDKGNCVQCIDLHNPPLKEEDSDYSFEILYPELLLKDKE